MSDLEKDRNKIEDRTSNGQYAFRVKSILYIGDCIRELTEQFKDINKNLEKIADKDFMQIGDLKTTVNNVGRFLDPRHVDINLDTIICNKNKDGHIDKNIILD